MLLHWVFFSGAHMTHYIYFLMNPWYSIEVTMIILQHIHKQWYQRWNDLLPNKMYFWLQWWKLELTSMPLYTGRLTRYCGIRACFNIKIVSRGIGIPIIMILWSWDHIIITMRILILVRHIYFESISPLKEAECCLQSSTYFPPSFCEYLWLCNFM